MRSNKLPDVNFLRNILTYDPKTGFLFWAIKSSRSIKFGQRAGFIEKHGYERIRICGKTYLSHKIAWAIYYGSDCEKQIDHINGIRSDNRISNLREATANENARNRKIQKNNTSGIRGVEFNKNYLKWRASIRVDKKSIFLGQFDNPQDAAKARKDAEELYHGKFKGR